MYIQLKDLDLTTEKKDVNVFIVHTYGTEEVIYISRAYICNDPNKYLSTNQGDAIVYFNRQAAEAVLTHDFKYLQLPLTIESIKIDSVVKEQAKKEDSQRKRIKNAERRERMSQYERNDSE